jgi:fibronectin-binding autotransporter adhesin
MRTLFRIAALAVVALLWHVAPTVAQTTYTWSGATSTSWATAGNWDTLPAPGTGTRIVLAGTTNTATVVDFTTLPFELNRLQQNSTAANGFQVSGGGLRFVGSGAVIQSSSTGGPLRVNSAIDFAANTTINSLDNFSAGSEIILAGRLTSNVGTVLTFEGGVGAGQVLTGSNNTGLNGTLALASGTQTLVVLGGQNTVSRTTTIDVTGGSNTSGFRTATAAATGPGFSDAGFNQQLGGLSGTRDSDNGITAGSFQIGSAAAASTVLSGFNNANTALTSNTTTGANLSTGNAASHFGKVGTGTFTYGGSGTFGAGSVSVRDGAVVLASASGSSGAFQNGNNAQGDISIYAGATLRLNNGTGSANNQNRIGNTATVVLAGGTLQLDGNATGATSERIAGVRLTSGQSVVELNANARGTRFTLVNTITPSSTASLMFRGAGLGEVSSTSTTTAANGFNFDTLANVTSLLSGNVTTGVYSAPATDLGILRFATSGTGTTSDSFVTFDSANNSVRRLADSNYAANFDTPTSNVSLATTANVGGPTTINALRMTSAANVVNASTLTLTAGALLNNGGGDVTGSGTLEFGAGGARTAYITTNNAMGISNAISAANLSKNGAGNLTLTGATTLTGTAGNTVAVNAGTLTLGAGSSVATANALSSTNTLTYQVSRGAALDATANGLTVGNFTTLSGGGTAGTGGVAANQARVVGNVTVNSGGTITPSALGGSNTSLLSPGTLTVVGDVALNGGSTYVWATNSSITNGDNGATPTAGTLNNYKSEYTASLLSVSGDLNLNGADAGNRVVLKLTSLTLANELGALYDVVSDSSRSWVLIEAGSITGFSADKFTLDTSAFSGLDTTRLSVSQVGNSLVLTFTPVPEPGSILAVCGAVTAGGLLWRRLRRKPAADATGVAA